MNFKRGFFRLWVALAVLWIGAAVYINWESLALTRLLDIASHPDPKPWDQYALPSQRPPFTVVTMPDDKMIDFGDNHTDNVRSFIIERYPDFDFSTYTWRLFEARKRILENARNRRSLNAFMIISFPPFILLGLGLVFGWIARGFSLSRG